MDKILNIAIQSAGGSILDFTRRLFWCTTAHVLRRIQNTIFLTQETRSEIAFQCTFFTNIKSVPDGSSSRTKTISHSAIRNKQN